MMELLEVFLKEHLEKILMKLEEEPPPPGKFPEGCSARTLGSFLKKFLEDFIRVKWKISQRTLLKNSWRYSWKNYRKKFQGSDEGILRKKKRKTFEKNMSEQLEWFMKALLEEFLGISWKKISKELQRIFCRNFWKNSLRNFLKNYCRTTRRNFRSIKKWSLGFLTHIIVEIAKYTYDIIFRRILRKTVEEFPKKNFYEFSGRNFWKVP